MGGGHLLRGRPDKTDHSSAGDEVLLCHRSPKRALHPGAWDPPGGHVRPGEPPHLAVRRELWEELGIVVGPRPTPHASFEGVGRTLDCWRFDRWQGVIGNRAPEEHTEVGWCGLDEISELPMADERLRSWLMGHLSSERVHCLAVVGGSLGREVEALRRVWDPRMAQGVPAHLTVAYPGELHSGDSSCRADLADAVRQVRPFRMRLREVVGVDEGRGGVVIRADDLDGGWSLARRRILGDRPALRVDPHVTVAHPNTSHDPQAAWRALRTTTFERTFVVRELLVTRTRDHRVEILRRSPLRDPFRC